MRAFPLHTALTVLLVGVWYYGNWKFGFGERASGRSARAQAADSDANLPLASHRPQTRGVALPRRPPLPGAVLDVVCVGLAGGQGLPHRAALVGAAAGRRRRQQRWRRRRRGGAAAQARGCRKPQQQQQQQRMANRQRHDRCGQLPGRGLHVAGVRDRQRAGGAGARLRADRVACCGLPSTLPPLQRGG